MTIVGTVVIKKGRSSMREFKSHPFQFFILSSTSLCWLINYGNDDYKSGRLYKISIFTDFIAHD